MLDRNFQSRSKSRIFLIFGPSGNPYLHNVRAIRTNRFKPAIHTFLAPPKCDLQRKVQFNWEKLNRGVSKPGCFPLFSGKVQIVSRTLSGLFLVGALNKPRKRNGTNRENPRTIPEQIGNIPEKSGKSQKGQKRTKKEGRVQIGKPPRLKHPRLAALEIWGTLKWFARIIRKILVSVKFVSAILGPEMGAPILWTAGKMRSFCKKNHVRKIPPF